MYMGSGFGSRGEVARSKQHPPYSVKTPPQLSLGLHPIEERSLATVGHLRVFGDRIAVIQRSSSVGMVCILLLLPLILSLSKEMSGSNSARSLTTHMVPFGYAQGKL